MKLTKKQTALINRFNQPDTHLVVSGYPSDTKSGKNYGIAWYTKQTLEPMAKKYGQNFVVLAEKNGDNRPKLKANGHILVLRVFEQKRNSLYPQILTWLNRFNHIKNVYVHSEFGMSGNIWHFGLLIPFLFLIKLTGKQIYFYSHNVIDSVASLSGHINIKPGSLVEFILNQTIRYYYQALSIVSKKIIVLDPLLANRLSKFVKPSRIITTQIPVSSKLSTISQQSARKKLRLNQTDKIIVSFGFVTWYKGADWLADMAAKYQKENLKIILAGGQSYSLKSQAYYQDYYSKLVSLAKKHTNLIITGFLPESKIGDYIQAADLIILPYRGVMGSSGSLSHALSYNKPVMFSTHMKPMIVASQDIRKARGKFGLNSPDLTFSLDEKGYNQLIRTVYSRIKLKKLTKLSTALAVTRSIDTVIEKDYKAIYLATDTPVVNWLAKLVPSKA